MRFFGLILLFISFSLHSQFRFSFESGLAFSQYNDVRAPNGSQPGTRFSLEDDFARSSTVAFLRVEANYTIAERHIVEVVAAPLALEYEELETAGIDFQNTFFSGAEVSGRYEFNTYRASYRYRFVDRPAFSLDLGATGLLRDAKVEISDQGQSAQTTDLGFVPLLSFQMKYDPFTKIAFLVKGDALVGPRGRAEDIFFGSLYQLLENKLQLKAGYRFIEGGADVDQVYNFAYVHFINIGLLYRL